MIPGGGAGTAGRGFRRIVPAGHVVSDDVAARLAKALPGILRAPVGSASRPLSAIIAALEPVVRELMAEKIEALADDPELSHIVDLGRAGAYRVIAASDLYARAATLRVSRG